MKSVVLGNITDAVVSVQQLPVCLGSSISSQMFGEGVTGTLLEIPGKVLGCEIELFRYFRLDNGFLVVVFYILQYLFECLHLLSAADASYIAAADSSILIEIVEQLEQQSSHIQVFVLSMFFLCSVFGKFQYDLTNLRTGLGFVIGKPEILILRKILFQKTVVDDEHQTIGLSGNDITLIQNFNAVDTLTVGYKQSPRLRNKNFSINEMPGRAMKYIEKFQFLVPVAVSDVEIIGVVMVDVDHIERFVGLVLNDLMFDQWFPHGVPPTVKHNSRCF